MLRRDLRLEWVVSFLAVLDTGSFSAAAEATHRSQPRVSTYVGALERAAGLPLFDRSTRPVTVTEAGRELAGHLRNILGELEAADAAMAALRDGTRGLVTLGSFPSPSAAFVPAVLERFAVTNPGIEVRLVERSTLELDAAHAAGELDFYLRPVAPPPHPEPSGRAPLWSESLVVAHPHEHPLARLPEPLRVRDITDHPLIVIGRRGSRECGPEVSALFHAQGLEARPRQATTQPQTLFALVKAGLGVGVLNALAASICTTAGLAVRQLDSGAHRRRVAVFWDNGRPMSTAARTLFDAVLSAPLPPECE
ncbi:LysR family transcriptional regulator [Allokutzneria sp. A3M-2-11 16]|uniref:LysR family transcriptional regulator n=1 Tax=Allokutzneria sp. A3M-2-11 16 TaxID=2962043 RepID=UPI0020B7AE85|nr:LysR family transcriptional regulator [Allokutzneria sp. A3M-2-11 16]MCP3804852.1 LysR family transcriptional regulator [Allokutzneria sp. A3M-2-11 16]